MDKKYNNWPSTSKLNVAPLGRKEIAIFRLLDTYNPNTKKYSLRTQLIASNGFVSDPDTNEVFESAYVRSWKANGDATFGDIWFEPSNMCLVHLRGNSIEDQKKYQFMMTSNEFAGNPNRDTNITLLFEQVTADSDAKALRAIRDKRREALSAIDQMSDDDVAAYFRINGKASGGSPEERRNIIEEIAEKNPAEFIKGVVLTGLGDVIAEVEGLVARKVINYDRPQAIWYLHTGKVLKKLTKAYNLDAKMELAKYLNGNEKVRVSLQEELDKVLEGTPTKAAKAKSADKDSE